jgi:hypothetical protein
MLSGRGVAVCYLIALWSGFFVMGVELLGGRLQAPNFGSSIYVWGALITIFMLALSLGYLAGGRYSQRNPSLAKLGLLLAAAALTTLPVLPLSGITLENLAIAIPDPRFGSLAAAALLFFVPTFFSGMVSPYGGFGGIVGPARRTAVFRLHFRQCRGHHPHLVLSGAVVRSKRDHHLVDRHFSCAGGARRPDAGKK